MVAKDSVTAENVFAGSGQAAWKAAVNVSVE